MFQNKYEKRFLNQLALLLGHTAKKSRYWYGMKLKRSPVYITKDISKIVLQMMQIFWK